MAFCQSIPPEYGGSRMNNCSQRFESFSGSSRTVVGSVFSSVASRVASYPAMILLPIHCTGAVLMMKCCPSL